jgi:O-antigen/teichoic acid export membrane protein
MGQTSEKANVPEIPEVPDAVAPDYGSARTIMVGTVVKSAGEIVAKIASVVFYVVIARKLGDTDFGNFVFALSLSQVLFTISAFGTDGLVTREVARDDSRAAHLLGDVMSLKLLSGFGLLLVMAGIVVVEGYSPDAATAILIVGLGVGLETVTKTVYAVFQARSQMHYEALSMIIERTAVAIFGTAAVLLGGGLVLVASIFAAGSIFGLATALFWLWRNGWPGWSSNRSRWIGVIRQGIPIGLIIVLYATLLKVDIALLSFLNGGDNTEVGHYGAAYRLIEATMFISWAFGAALFPSLSRDDASSDGFSAARGYEFGMKIMIAILMPIALIFGIYAAQIINLLYGPEYSDAVLSLRLLAAMTVLYGINSLVVTVLITRDRPWDFAKPAIIVIVQNLAFNFILIPRYGAPGAAANAIFSGLLLAVITWRQTAQIFGHISVWRLAATPAIASLAMAAVIFAAWSGPWIPCAILSLAVYAAVFFLAERYIFPADFVHYGGVLAPLRRRLAPGRAAG